MAWTPQGKGQRGFCLFAAEDIVWPQTGLKSMVQQKSEVLFLLALKISVNEPCVLLRMRKGNLIIALYVDQAVIFANDESEKLSVKNELMSRFEMKDLGKARKVF